MPIIKCLPQMKYDEKLFQVIRGLSVWEQNIVLDALRMN